MEIPRTIGNRRHRLLITSVAWVAYVAGFSPLYPLFTTHTGVLAFVPLLLTAWYWGSIAGALAGLAAAGATVALSGLTAGTSPTGWMSAASLLETAAFVLTGYAVGRWRDLDTQRHAEATERLGIERDLREQGSRLALVNSITKKIKDDESVDLIVQAVVKRVGEYFPEFDTSYATADLGGFHAVCTQRRSGELDTARRRVESPVSQNYLDHLKSSDLLAIDDVSVDTLGGMLEDTLIALDIRAYLSAPIPHSDGIIGLLAIHGPALHRWNEHEKSTVRDAADVLAVALADASRKQRLRESEETFRMLAEHSQVHISLAKREGLVYANHAMQRITGYTKAELRSLDLMALIAPEHRERERELAERRFGGEPLDTPHELKLIGKDGRQRWIELTGCTIDLGGEPTLLTSAVETTARKQAEELLLESESRLRNVLDQLGDGVAVITNDQLLYVNPTLCRMFGYETEELLRTDPVDLLQPDARQEARRLMDAQVSEAVTGGETAELGGRHKNGSRIPVEAITRRITYGGSPAVLATIRDLTSRKRAEQAVREQEERMQILLDQHPDGVLLIVDGKVAYANSAICKMSGREAEELIGQDPLATVTPHDYDRARQRLGEATQGLQSVPTEYHSLRPDGGILPVEVVASPPVQYRGSTAVFVTIRDLSERRRAERAVREAEEKYRGLFEQAPIGIVVAKPDSTFVQVNAAFCEMIGYAEDELVGKSFVDITHTDDIGGTQASAARVLEDAKSVTRFQKRYLRKDGSTVQAETTVSVVRDGDGAVSYALAMIEDVTERRLLEHQLEHIQRLESVGQLAGGVAHNFNNALTAIYGYSELLERRFGPDDPARKDLEQIKRVAEQSASLTRQLLAFSRKEQVRPSIFPLNDLVVETRDMLEPILGDHVEMVSQLETSALVHCDRGQMEQVVTNLVLNARDAMPSGGTLTVETCDTTVDDAFALSHPEARPGSYVRLTVTDTGLGMDDETLRRVFEPFFTTKEQGKGVGLGLAMVHGAVTQGGGFVTVASTVGIGSSFSVYLPQHRDLETQSHPAKVDTSTTP